VLELTERASLQHVEALEAQLGALRALGFRLAVDDLGAGYSGLSTFARVQPEFVKLDGSLVRGIEVSPSQQSVVKAMMDLAAKSGSQVIAEAIETDAERRALLALGVQWMQGFLFGRPGKPFVAGKKAA
jgi:EAL domain-containing protein (putative c-di-GMP-specific phosphodiesterase class I)